jgi:D-3-phosphoglycerate dehydrogenase
MMRIFVCDKFEESGLARLKKIGCEVLYQPESKTEDQIISYLQNFKPDVLIVRSTKVTAKVLEAAPLKVVLRAGAGVNTIDVAACSQRGVYVSNCPGKNSIAVAELAFGLIFALDRRIVDNTVSLQNGQWNKKDFSQARGLYGRTLGLVGLGNIGIEMIPRARAFGLKIIAWSRSLTPERAELLEIECASDLTSLAKQSDIISLHLSLNKETQKRIDRLFFDAMKPGSYLVNTSRAEIIDAEALTKAIQEKSIRYAADVFYDEPSASTGSFSDPLIQKHHAYGTHHIGASTEQAQEAIAAETVRIIESFKTTGKVPNAVNLAKQTPATHCLTVRHRDRPGVLAGVLTAIRAEGINVQEMENVIFDGAEAAVAHINLDRAPKIETVKKLKSSNADILDLDLFAL